MASNSGNNVSAYYSRIASQLYNTLGSILIGIGSVGAVLSCIIFARKTMRKNPGSIYFIAYNAANLLVMLLSLLPPVIAFLTKFDLTVYSLPFCKIVFYLRLALPALSRYYLVLASIDRTLVTSSNAMTRQRSNHRLAYWSIVGVTFINLVFHVHVFVGVNIYQIYPGYYLCYYQAGNYRTFVAYSNLLISGIAPWFLLSVFAVLTLKNLNRIHITPVIAVTSPTNPHRSKDRQRAIILLSEILIYIMFSSATPVYGTYQQITQYNIKSVQQTAIETFVLQVVFLLTFVSPATSFYVNLVVSKTFRQKTTELLCKRRQHRSIHDSQSQNPTATAMDKRITIK
jgi:hypothetical protein